MKVACKARGVVSYDFWVQHRVTVPAVDITRVVGLHSPIKDNDMKESTRALYKVHKECTYYKVVYNEILRAFIEAKGEIDNDGWAKMIEQDSGCKTSLYDCEGQENVNYVADYIETAKEAVGTFYEYTNECFASDKKLDHMNKLMWDIFATFSSERMDTATTKVVLSDESGESDSE